TGSMAMTNPGDTQPRIAVLRDTIRSFYAQLEANRSAGARVRYGFVPYSSNVNVGYLLRSDWMVDEMTIQARVSDGKSKKSAATPVSGAATALPTTTAATCPASDVDWVDLSIEDRPTGQKGRSVLNGIEYSCEANASTGLFTVS